MEPTQTQNLNPQPQELTADEAKASLGIATRLSEQFFNPKQEQPMEQTPQEGGDIEAKLEAFKKEISAMVKEEVGSIRQDIQDALKDDNDNETE